MAGPWSERRDRPDANAADISLHSQQNGLNLMEWAKETGPLPRVCALRPPPAGLLLANRQLNTDYQSMGLPVIEGQLAAVRQHNGARD